MAANEKVDLAEKTNSKKKGIDGSENKTGGED
jgi:hypothetical protein